MGNKKTRESEEKLVQVPPKDTDVSTLAFISHIQLLQFSPIHISHSIPNFSAYFTKSQLNSLKRRQEKKEVVKTIIEEGGGVEDTQIPCHELTDQ